MNFAIQGFAPMRPMMVAGAITARSTGSTPLSRQMAECSSGVPRISEPR